MHACVKVVKRDLHGCMCACSMHGCRLQERLCMHMHERVEAATEAGRVCICMHGDSDTGPAILCMHGCDEAGRVHISMHVWGMQGMKGMHTHAWVGDEAGRDCIHMHDVGVVRQHTCMHMHARLEAENSADRKGSSQYLSSSTQVPGDCE